MHRTMISQESRSVSTGAPSYWGDTMKTVEIDPHAPVSLKIEYSKNKYGC
jgi:hypothetical protein